MSDLHVASTLIFSIVLAAFFIAAVSIWIMRVRRLNQSIRHAQELIAEFERNEGLDKG